MKMAGQKTKEQKLTRKRDGFVFNNSKIDTALYDFIYGQIPFGRRRDELKRLILLGFIAETGYQLAPDDRISPTSIPSEIDVDDVVKKLLNVKNIKNDEKQRLSQLNGDKNDINRVLYDEKVVFRLIPETLYNVIENF